MFYRASAKQMADLLGIAGFVRNEADGAVFIEAEAEQEWMVKFIQWCHHGPDKAEVEHVSVRDGELVNYEGFEIRK